MNCKCGKPIAEHESGRELDFCIAVRTGYFTPHGDNYAHSSGFGVVIRSKEEWLELDRHPHFSTQWAAVEGLVEEMVEAGDGFMVDKGIAKYSENWRVQIKTKQGWLIIEDKTTLPHALSLAYLTWAAGKEGGEGDG